MIEGEQSGFRLCQSILFFCGPGLRLNYKIIVIEIKVWVPALSVDVIFWWVWISAQIIVIEIKELCRSMLLIVIVLLVWIPAQ